MHRKIAVALPGQLLQASEHALLLGGLDADERVSAVDRLRDEIGV